MIPRYSYAIEQRLRFIDFLLDEYGQVNRSALMDYFGISKPQASKDLKDYTHDAPDNATYDLSRKCYVRARGFKRVWP